MRKLKPLMLYLARYWPRYVLGVSLLLVSSIINLTQPYLLRLGIDNLQLHQSDLRQSGLQQFWFCLLIILIGLVQLGIGFVLRRSIQLTSHRVEADIRSDLFGKIQKLDRSFFDETSIGDLIVLSTSDISVQCLFLTQGTISGFNTLFLGGIAFFLMFSQNWRLAIIGLIFLPFLTFAFAWIGKHMKHHYSASQKQLGVISNRAQEILAGIRVVKAYTREEIEIERYAAENQQYLTDMLRFARLNNLTMPLVTLYMGLTTALLLWVGGNEIAAGRLTIGQFVQFNAYLLALALPLSNLGTVYGMAQQAVTRMSRLQEIFTRRPRIMDPEEVICPEPNPAKVPDSSTGSLRGAVEFKNVSLRFGDRWVLRDVSFRAEAGKTIAVVGPTGAGKSSLATMVGRIYDPDEGAVLLDGLDVRMLPLEVLRREVAYVPQETLLFSLPLRENIAFGKGEAEDEEVLYATNMSRLLQDLPQIPGGLDAMVGERGITLSGGQKQRTAIARALLPEASILILDDALSSVDARTQNHIAANLKTLTQQGRTILIVTQRLTLVKDADWIVVLDGGQIVEQGTHAHLLQQQRLYARMYHREQATTHEHNIIDDDVLAEVIAPLADGGTEPPPMVSRSAIPSKPKRRQEQAKKDNEDDDEIVGLDYEGGRLTRLMGYVWRYWRILLLALPMIVGASLQDLVGPLLSKTAIDQFITSGRLDGLWLILVLFLVVAFASFIFRYLRSYLMQKIGQAVVRDLRVQLFGHLLHQSLSFFDRYSSGSLIGRLTSDMDAINDLLSMGAISVASDIVTLLAIVIMMLLLDWRLALVSLAVLPMLFLVSMYFRKVLQRAWRSSRRRYSVLVGYLAENYTGMLTVQLFNRQATNYARFQELNTDYYKSNRLIVTANGLFMPFVTFLSSFANASLLLVGSLLFINIGTSQSSVITLGLLVAFLQYTERAFQPLRDIAERYTLFQAASASSERIFGLLDQPSEIQDPPQPRPLVSDAAASWGEVRFEQVEFGYNPAFPVLKDISFTIHAGEKIAIVGATGAGKTSIISLLGRHYDVQQGHITIGGVDIREVSQQDLRHHLALVLQDPVLFKGTIAENIGLGRTDLSDKEMRQAACYVGADSFITQLPEGYNYELQERGSNISAGQRQLISFARAIAYNPKAILILDEATSSVDTESEAIIQEALKKVLKNRTALIIAHRLSTIRDVDRVMVIDRGRIVEFGTQTELIARRGFYYQLYTHQLALTKRL